MLTLACELLFILPTFDLVRCINRINHLNHLIQLYLKSGLIAIYITEFHRTIRNLFQHLFFIQGFQIKIKTILQYFTKYTNYNYIIIELPRHKEQTRTLRTTDLIFCAHIYIAHLKEVIVINIEFSILYHNNQMKNRLSHNIKLFYVMNTNFCIVRVLADLAMTQHAKNMLKTPFFKLCQRTILLQCILL